MYRGEWFRITAPEAAEALHEQAEQLGLQE